MQLNKPHRAKIAPETILYSKNGSLPMLRLSVPRLLATSGSTMVKTLVPIMALSAEGYISLLTILEVTDGTII